MDENYLKSIYGEVDTKLSVMRNYDLELAYFYKECWFEE